MKFGFPQYYQSKARYQTYQIVKIALEAKGHEVVPDINGVDAVLFSMCDVMEYRALMKMRNETKGVPLIVGGGNMLLISGARNYTVILFGSEKCLKWLIASH